ncbi:hypothetical protein [Shewanella sp.]|uniref:hypothetical protein n=1 Tax=Shewanella sp. TaxID=50422 RepID=UPI000EC3003B|nr:hypothetical protein [Shewanella sp.]HCD12818.1 hypothetical protein [Shewanella sp.]
MAIETLYDTLQALEKGVQALTDVADDWCEEDRKYALVQLLADNLNQQLTVHQQAVYASMAVLEQHKPVAA